MNQKFRTCRFSFHAYVHSSDVCIEGKCVVYVRGLESCTSRALYNGKTGLHTQILQNRLVSLKIGFIVVQIKALKSESARKEGGEPPAAAKVWLIREVKKTSKRFHVLFHTVPSWCCQNAFSAPLWSGHHHGCSIARLLMRAMPICAALASGTSEA
jgi:hypothetical protein